MDREEKDALLRLRQFGQDTDFELWIVLDFVAEQLNINYRKGMTVAQGETLWSSMSEVISGLLQNGFIAFSFVGRGERDPWPEQDPKQVMAKIKSRWVEYKGKFPNVGFIVWFHNSCAVPNKYSLKQ